jgi:hypothetical protein
MGKAVVCIMCDGVYNGTGLKVMIIGGIEDNSAATKSWHGGVSWVDGSKVVTKKHHHGGYHSTLPVSRGMWFSKGTPPLSTM